MVDPDGARLIDHVAVSENFEAEVHKVIPKHTEVGLKLSDHAGVVFDLVKAGDLVAET